MSTKEIFSFQLTGALFQSWFFYLRKVFIKIFFIHLAIFSMVECLVTYIFMSAFSKFILSQYINTNARKECN